MTRLLILENKIRSMNEVTAEEVERIRSEISKRQQEKIEAEFEKVIYGNWPVEEKKSSFPDCKPVIPSVVVDWKVNS